MLIYEQYTALVQVLLFTNEQLTVRMKAFSQPLFYPYGMIEKSRLRQLREAAGISQRELARQIGQVQSNIRYWEASGNLPRSEVLIPMAKALGVTVEEILGEDKTRRTVAPGGKLGQVFEEAAKLPRRQQQKIIEMAEAYIAQYHQSRKESTP